MSNNNVIDKYREWTLDLIRDDLKKNAFPYGVMMQHLNGDFNISTVIRNANAFGAQEVFYFGKRHIDRRGTVGTHLYTNVTFLETREDILRLKERYTFVAMECGVRSVAMPGFVWPKNPLIVLGEETSGITQDLLDECDHIVNIPMFGSVRSINVGTASGIAMNDFVTKYQTLNPLSHS